MFVDERWELHLDNTDTVQEKTEKHEDEWKKMDAVTVKPCWTLICCCSCLSDLT